MGFTVPQLTSAFWILAAFVVVGLLLIVLLQKRILDRLAWLNRSVREIGEKGNLQSRVTMTGKDELAQLANEINSMLDAIEKAVMERDRLQAQVQQTMKLRSVATFAVGIAHEINNPLNNLQLNLSSLLMIANAGKTIDATTLEERVERAKKEIGHISEIVKHMRSLVQEDGNAVVNPVSLRPALDKAMELVAHRLHNIDATVNIDIAVDLPKVKANPLQLSQVLCNLIANALLAMKKSGTEKKTIDIAAVSQDNHIRLTVKDNGPGLGDSAEQVFDPFFSTNREDGMGLGLSIVHSFVTGWGASIDACDNPEGGACFTIIFPHGEE